MAYCSISGLVTKKINSFADTSLVDVCSCVVVSHMNHCRLDDILCRLFQVLCRLKHIIGLSLQLFCSDRCRQTWIIAGSLTFSAGCSMFSADSNTSLVDVCTSVALIDADTHGSLQALWYSLQAVPCSLQANRANLNVDWNGKLLIIVCDSRDIYSSLLGMSLHWNKI